ncbi:hypothetical protein LCGC14_1720170 [marine sediment metagenome]|uniref:Uncharacterized protein n=1 Tax=marine sediment metagenome TaxID=412755 RepID=A0A0F9I0G0_9ZZZZ
MPIIEEKELIKKLKKAKKILLIEPPYRRKYIPLGLAKIASFAKNNGSEVIFQRGYSLRNVDLICITSLFTYDSQKVHGVIDSIYKSFLGIGRKYLSAAYMRR